MGAARPPRQLCWGARDSPPLSPADGHKSRQTTPHPREGGNGRSGTARSGMALATRAATGGESGAHPGRARSARARQPLGGHAARREGSCCLRKLSVCLTRLLHISKKNINGFFAISNGFPIAARFLLLHPTPPPKPAGPPTPW